MKTGFNNIYPIQVSEIIDNVTDTCYVEPTCSGDEDQVGGTSVHNALQGLQGGDFTNRYHLDRLSYDAILAAPDRSAENRFAVLSDLQDTSLNLYNPSQF